MYTFLMRIFSKFILSAALTARLAAQVTETPYTIAPGKFLVEMDALSFAITRDDSGPNKFSALGLATTRLSTGFSSNVDVQIGMQLFLRQTFEIRGTSERRSGLGDVTLRTKWTYWRNASQTAAAAVIPYVKVPTSTGGVSNNHIEAGIIFPWATSLRGGTVAGAMGSWEVVRNDANNGYDSQWFASGSVEQDLVGPWGVYAEATVSISSATSSSFAGGLGGGTTWDFSEEVQLEYGISRGLGNRATDWLNVVRLKWSF